MKENFIGRLMVRVTVNGCGLPIAGAQVTVEGKEYRVPYDGKGFTEIIPIFISEKKGIKKFIPIKAEHGEFDVLTEAKVPITSGYLTVWNMPLNAKVKNDQKNRKNEKTI